MAAVGDGKHWVTSWGSSGNALLQICFMFGGPAGVVEELPEKGKEQRMHSRKLAPGQSVKTKKKGTASGSGIRGFMSVIPGV